MDIRYAPDPVSAKRLDTTELRKHFLIDNLFMPDDLVLVYSHVDRMISGSAVPVKGSVKLEADLKTIGAPFFLARRELGVVNIGGEGTVTVDGTDYPMSYKDCLYVGMGTKEVVFTSKDSAAPAKFYLASAPAHTTYPTVKASIAEATPVELGDILTSNKRTIYKFIHPQGIKSCQLVLGFTSLQPGNMWNSMPCHTHDRRMEVYCYFELPKEALLFHLMGEPTETRHIVMRNEQAVISPSWSIHAGVGTSNYSFIWAMAGENQTFDDMDAVSYDTIK